MKLVGKVGKVHETSKTACQKTKAMMHFDFRVHFRKLLMLSGVTDSISDFKSLFKHVKNIFISFYSFPTNF